MKDTTFQSQTRARGAWAKRQDENHDPSRRRLDWFKDRVEEAGGGNYQSLINTALREHRTDTGTSGENAPPGCCAKNSQSPLIPSLPEKRPSNTKLVTGSRRSGLRGPVTLRQILQASRPADRRHPSTVCPAGRCSSRAAFVSKPSMPCTTGPGSSPATPDSSRPRGVVGMRVRVCRWARIFRRNAIRAPAFAHRLFAVGEQVVEAVEIGRACDCEGETPRLVVSDDGAQRAASKKTQQLADVGGSPDIALGDQRSENFGDGVISVAAHGVLRRADPDHDAMDRLQCRGGRRAKTGETGPTGP